MVQMALPSGQVLDFGDASDEQIQNILSTMKDSNPELFEESSPDLSTASYEELQKYYGAQESTESGRPKVEITHAGELESLAAQYDYAKADTDKGRADWITRRYGPGTFGQDEKGRFYLKLDNIDADLKSRDNLEDSGTMYINRPDGSFLGLMDLSDVVSFGGQWQGPLVGTTAAAFASTGVGLPMSALIMGLGAAGGKIFDEFIEESFIRNRQDQTNPEIWGDVGTEFLFGAGGELLVGSAIRGIRKFVKGSGKPDAARIDELVINGIPRKRAKQIATQEARAQLRGDIKAGAAPSIYEATGKTIAGRLQAVHEGIFGNVKAAAKNRKYVSGLWESYLKGNLDETSFKAAMEQNANDVTRIIQNAMKDPDEAVRLADRRLRKTIQGEMDILLNAFASGSKQSNDWQKAMGQTVRLWQQDSAVLYKTAEDLLGDVTFSKAPIQKIANDILDSAEAKMGNIVEAPLLNYIKNKGDDFTLTELNALRHTLSAQAKHPDLVGTASDFQIKSLKDAVDQMFSQKASSLAKEIAAAEAAPGAAQFGGTAAVRGPGGRFLPIKDIQEKRNGLEKLVEANKHYTEGAEVFKTGAANMINRNITDGFFEDLIDVAQTVVQNKRPELLKAHLARITPSSSTIGKIQSIEPSVWQSAAQMARNGDIDGLNRLLVSNNIPENVVLRPQAFLNDLPVDDLYRKRTMDQLAQTLDQYADDAIARAGSLERRNVNRDMLAGAWLKNASEESMKGRMFNPGQFAQKFDDLGKETQDLLFGAQQAASLRQTLGDFYLVGTNKQDWSNVILNNIANPNMKSVVSSLQNDLRIASDQSQDALFKAIRSGSIDNADELIAAAIKNPRLVDALRNRVGDGAFNVPGGLQDQAMQRIMLEAFPDGVTTEAVQSGSFGPAMLSAITKMNKQGALNKILGEDVVKGLLDVSRTATRVGDASLKGKGGLAAAGYAAAFGLSLLTNPVGTLVGAGGILLSARLMRNKHFLNWMTKPTIRARDAKLGIEIIADELQTIAQQQGKSLSRAQARNQAKNQMGDLPISLMRVKEALSREARASGLFIPASGQIDSEIREDISEGLEAVSQSAPVEALRSGVKSIQQQMPDTATAAQQVNPLRQIEMNKLMTGRP
tara:strand:+ start:1057 stop:4431 length:3375 start_codon:yes stop_codon:yes gene_type:complete